MGTYHVVGHIDTIVELDVEAKDEEQAWDEFCDQAGDEISLIDWKKRNCARVPRTHEPEKPWELVDALCEPKQMGKWKLGPSHCVAIGRMPASVLTPASRPQTILRKYADISIDNHPYSLAQISEGLEAFGADVKGALPEFYLRIDGRDALLVIKPVPGDLYIIVSERVSG